MTQHNDIAHLTQSVERIEESLSSLHTIVEERLHDAPETFSFMKAALDAHTQHHVQKARHSIAVREAVFQRVWNDHELSYPHRKTLEYLASLYDFAHERFGEAHYSDIVKKAHLCKRRAKSYLRLLERKGYIQKRTDGYRVFYKLVLR